MTRGEFIAAIAGSVTAVKAVGQTAADGSTPKQKRLLAIECNRYLRSVDIERFREHLAPYEQRYGFEFIILGPEMRIVDPGVPATRESA